MQYAQSLPRWSPMQGLRAVLAVTAMLTIMAATGFIQTATAHGDPDGCTATGVGVSLATFRDAAATDPVFGSDVVESGEEIFYRAELTSLGGSNCNYEGGTLTITTPDGTTTNVTPGGGIPLVSTSTPFKSSLVSYTVSEGDVGVQNGPNPPQPDELQATADYDGGTSHTGASHDTVSGQTTRNVPYQDIALDVSKDANPTFDRTHRWDIDKSVDVDSHDLLTGETGDSVYTVDVTKTTEDDNYSVSGTITITNPASFADAEITDVSDVISGAGSATVTCDETLPHTLGPGETLECTYSAALPDDSTRTNTATVTTSGDVDGGSGEASVDFTGVEPEVIGFDEVTITDTNSEFASQNGGDPVTTNASQTYTYDVGFTCDDTGENPNTATIVETAQSDDALVTVTCSNPSVSVEKTGDELSKIGDDVTYTFNVENTGDTTLYMESFSDNVLGDLSTEATTAGCDELASGSDCTFNVNYTVQSDDPDPLVNEVSILYDTAETLDGNEVSSSDTHSLNLFQPSVSVTKTGPSEAMVGDTVTYNYTIENTSSNDTPNLLLASVIDDVIGDITTDATSAGCGTLASTDTCNFTAEYTVQESDTDPLVNVVDVLYNPEGFQNEITDSDSHSITIQTIEFAGCTPGFWKNHTNVWQGYDEDDLFSSVFEDAFPGQTLLDVANQGGGGLNALGRHTVAALLNAAHPDVEYPMTEQEVIDAFNDVFPGSKSDYNALKDQFETFNEEGCSIDAHGNPEGGEESEDEGEEIALEKKNNNNGRGRGSRD